MNSETVQERDDRSRRSNAKALEAMDAIAVISKRLVNEVQDENRRLRDVLHTERMRNQRSEMIMLLIIVLTGLIAVFK